MNKKIELWAVVDNTEYIVLTTSSESVANSKAEFMSEPEKTYRAVHLIDDVGLIRELNEALANCACDECDGSGRYFIDGKEQVCICEAGELRAKLNDALKKIVELEKEVTDNRKLLVQLFDRMMFWGQTIHMLDFYNTIESYRNKLTG